VLGEGRGARKATKTLPTRKAAASWQQEAKRKGMPYGPAAEQTVAQAFDAYLAARVLAPNTVKTFDTTKDHVVAAGLGSVKLANLKPSNVQTFTAYLSRAGLSASSVNVYAGKLATVLKFAAADGGLSFTPKSATVTEHRIEVPAIGPADIRALYEAASEDFAPVVLLGAFCGLRASEACAVTVGDIDFVAGTLSVNKAVDNKGRFVKTKTPRSIRTIPVADTVLVQLGPVCKGKSPSDTVAVNATGGVISTATFAKTFARVADDAGVDVTSHALRRFFATTLLASGVNPKAVAKFLGDTVETMLRTYALVQTSDDDAARVATAGAFAATVAA
jgi:integrase